MPAARTDYTAYPPVELYVLNKNTGLNTTGTTSFKCALPRPPPHPPPPPLVLSSVCSHGTWVSASGVYLTYSVCSITGVNYRQDVVYRYITGTQQTWHHWMTIS